VALLLLLLLLAWSRDCHLAVLILGCRVHSLGGGWSANSAAARQMSLTLLTLDAKHVSLSACSLCDKTPPVQRRTCYNEIVNEIWNPAAV